MFEGVNDFVPLDRGIYPSSGTQPPSFIVHGQRKRVRKIYLGTLIVNDNERNTARLKTYLNITKDLRINITKTYVNVTKNVPPYATPSWVKSYIPDDWYEKVDFSFLLNQLK